MSQVIVTKDRLLARRQETRKQELHIDKEGIFKKWQRSDITGPDFFAKIVGYTLMPVVVIWGLLTGFIVISLRVGMGVCRLIGSLLGSRGSR